MVNPSQLMSADSGSAAIRLPMTTLMVPPAARTRRTTRRSGASLSSVGIGTYLGTDDDATDALYEAAIEQAVVSGINVAIRHRKASQTNPQGGLERREAPMHVSKVAVADPKSGKATRVRFETRDGKKVRVAAKSGELING